MWRMIAFLALASALSAQTKVIGGGPKFDANGNLPIGATCPAGTPTGTVCASQLAGKHAGEKGNRTVWIGDSTFTTISSVNWLDEAVWLSGSKVYSLGQAGVVGNTTTQMLARFGTDVIALAPDKVVIEGGSVNDVAGSISAATTKANVQAMITAAKAAGIQPILTTICPSNTTAYHAGIALINQHARSLAAANQVLLVDMYAVLVDPANGNYKSGYNYDALHPSPAGMRVMAAQFVAQTASIYGTSTTQLTACGDGISMLANPCFLAPGSGTPTSWGITNGGTAPTPTFSTVTGDAAIVGNWWQTVQPLSATPGQYVVVGSNTISTGFAIGDRIAVSFRFQATGVEASGGGSWSLQPLGGAQLPYKWSADVADGTFYLEAVVPSDLGPTLRSAFVIYPGTAGAITIKVAQFTVVNLTALGL